MPEEILVEEATSEDFQVRRLVLSDLADQLKCRKQTLFKISKRLGITPEKHRDVSRKNQLVATVTKLEADEIVRSFNDGKRSGPDDSLSQHLIGETGYFYLVLLEPSLDPGRFKLGFTTNIQSRMQKHRCVTPFAVCLKAWLCRRTWEKAAIDCISAGAEQIHTEVFRTDNVNAILDRGEVFFALMPDPGTAQD